MSCRETRIWIVLALATLAMLAIGLFGMPPARAQPMPLPPCLAETDILASAQAATTGENDVAGSIDGIAAVRFLAYANGVGERTDYRGDGIVFAFFPDKRCMLTHSTGCATIRIMRYGCSVVPMTLDAASFLNAVRAAYPRERAGT